MWVNGWAVCAAKASKQFFDQVTTKSAWWSWERYRNDNMQSTCLTTAWKHTLYIWEIIVCAVQGCGKSHATNIDELSYCSSYHCPHVAYTLALPFSHRFFLHFHFERLQLYHLRGQNSCKRTSVTTRPRLFGPRSMMFLTVLGKVWGNNTRMV